MSLVAELRRRNVFRVAAAYLVVGWLLTEVLTTILPTIGAPEWMTRAVILIFALGAGISLYQGYTHLLHPSPLENVVVNYVVLGLAILWLFPDIVTILPDLIPSN